MSATFKSLEDQVEVDFYQEIETLIKKNPWAWQSVCAVAGLAGGVIAPILGAASDVTTWFVHSTSVNSQLHVLSIVLCALTLPLLIMGASCLDLLEAKISNLSPPADGDKERVTSAATIKQVARPNGNHQIERIGALVLLLFLLAFPKLVHAQQAIFNAPITDVLPPDKVIVESNVSVKPESPEARPSLSPSPLASTSPSESEASPRAEQQKEQSNPRWQYGGFVDLAYPLDFNHPANHLFRSRGTAFRTDSVWLNMAGFYVTSASRTNLLANAREDLKYLGEARVSLKPGEFRLGNS